MIPRNIVKDLLSQIKKISISTFKQYIFEIQTFCLVLGDPRSQIVSYHIFSFVSNLAQH
jgi:hypothetical protein